jgi:hypothetical protein
MSRIRHCVECPKCLTRYLIPFSPYRNGSYLIRTIDGCSDEYALYCSCRKSTAASVWRWNEVQTCAVSNAAYDRGYGTPEEIVPIRDRPQDSWSTDVARCLNNLISKEKGETPAISSGRRSDRLTHNAQGNQS